MKYRICVLYSGSTGNATLVETPTVSFLIDAGKNVKALGAALRSVGSDLSRISAVFVTHEHSDHVSALEVLSKKYHIPVHITAASAARFTGDPLSQVPSCMMIHDNPRFAAPCGEATVISFPIPHDSRMCVGYRIMLADGDKIVNIGFATDIGGVTEDVKTGLLGCETVVLESNHDPEMLLTGSYPYDLKVRIRGRGGHLSNSDSADLTAFLAENGLKHLILAHLSAENNRPDIAYDAHFAALAGTDVEIAVASPTDPVGFTVED